MKSAATEKFTKLNLNQIVLAISSAFISVGAQAQATDSVSTLPPVTVTADRVDGYVVPRSSLATKTDTPIEQIPQTVVVVPKQVIEDQGATKLSDVTTNVSNVQHFDQRDFSTISSFKIRGFNAGIVVDGVASPGYFGNLEPVYNMEQVDVVKGPGGSLYSTSQSTGADSVGGMIGITTKAPEAVAKQQVGFRVGSYNERALFADLNQPVNETLGIRLVAQTQSADSETDRVTTKQTLIAPSIGLNIDRDRKLVLRLKHIESEWLDTIGLPTATAARNGNLTAEGMPKSQLKTDSINAQYTQRLDDAWTFGMTLAHSQTNYDSRGMFYLAVGGGEAARSYAEMKNTVISPYLMTNFETGKAKHKAILGLEYSKVTDNGFIAVDPTSALTCLSGFGCTYSNYTTPYTAWSEPTSPTDPYNKVSSQTNAIYVQDQIDIDRWHFQAGLRHARMKIDDFYGNDPYVAAAVGLGFTDWSHNRSDTISKTLPRVGAVYDLTQQTSVFAGYGEGMKVPVGGTYQQAVKPEESEQTELGFRLKDWNGLSATLAWFDLTRTNVPTSCNTVFACQVGKQNSKGIDLNFVWRADTNISVLGGFSDQKAITVENQNSPTTVGKQLQNVPSQTARLAMRYDVRAGDFAGLGFGLGLRHHSQLPVDSTNSAFTPAVTVYDSQLSYRIKTVQLNLAVNNLLDKIYVVPSSQSTSSAPLYFPALRRTAMLTATIDF
jgi:iron complex outermembrane receptor protein